MGIEELSGATGAPKSYSGGHVTRAKAKNAAKKPIEFPKTSTAKKSYGAPTEQHESKKTDFKKDDPRAGGQYNISPVIKKRANDFYCAVDGIGTKNKTMERVLDETLADGSLVDLSKNWEDKYQRVHGETFIEAFMDDADHAQAKKYVPMMAESLYNEAQKLGKCDEKFKNAYSTVLRELSDSYWLNGMDDKLICANINSMIDRIMK